MQNKINTCNTQLSCSLLQIALWFQILNAITEDIMEHTGNFRNPLDQVDFIKKHYECGGEKKVFTDPYPIIRCQKISK